MDVKTPSLLVILLALASAAEAGDALAGHGMEAAVCQAPARPPDDVAEPVWQQFLIAVDRYRDCIDRRVAAEQAAAAAHDARARAAADAWSRFVHESLNAPEDFPWPTDDAAIP